MILELEGESEPNKLEEFDADQVRFLQPENMQLDQIIVSGMLLLPIQMLNISDPI